MYEKHFGLNRRPFLAKASGRDVFVGPQTAQTMVRFRKALQAQDAVVLVAGRTGCGKSTLVAKALEALETTHRSVRIGRMRLRGSDALDYLLEALGQTDLPSGPIRQFSRFRETLAGLENAGSRVVIVVEDALHLGAESLAELEALTAADAGSSGGAALVVMGDARLSKFLPNPALTRLAQRVHYCHQVLPMSEPELRGYLAHCIRLAGGEFENIFLPETVTAIRDLSQGIARVANKIVEGALSAAAANESQTIGADLILDVAGREFGLKRPGTTTPQPSVIETPKPLLEASSEKSYEDENPEPISNALPDLEELAPEIADSPADKVPDWDKDPTLAELRPDLDALEKAMAVSQGKAEDPRDADTEDLPVLQPDPEQPAEQSEEIPEITLDDAIQQRIDDSLIDEPGSVSASSHQAAAESNPDTNLPDIMLPPRKAKKADAELERITSELARAKSINDVDDQLAETLFGEEISLAAAEVAALAKAEPSSNDEDMSFFDTHVPQMAQAVGSPVSEGVEIALESRQPRNGSGLDASASQRLNTVRSLNAGGAGSPVDQFAPAAGTHLHGERGAPTPDPIEDQINTSMTQTLKALDVEPPVLDRSPRIDDDHDIGAYFDDDEHERQEKKGGFFSRFRRP
jgi:MSHA biogenesis protein MshM